MSADAPCTDWATLEGLAECCTACDFDTIDDAVKEAAITEASRVMYILLGRTLTGPCPVTVRPSWTGDQYNWRTSEGWVLRCNSIPLQWPVVSIEEVIIDGVVLDTSEYTIMDEKYLLRLADVDTRSNPGWPSCNRLDLPTTERGTWSISYTFGHDIPSEVTDAVEELACEILKECSVSGSSAFPPNTVSVSRGGVNVNLERVSASRLGNNAGSSSEVLFPAVVKALNLYNPTGQRVPTLAWAPELGHGLHSF